MIGESLVEMSWKVEGRLQDALTMEIQLFLSEISVLHLTFSFCPKSGFSYNFFYPPKNSP